MGAFFRFAQFVFGTTDHDFMAVVDECLDQVFQVKLARTSVHQCNIVDTERRLQSCQLIQFVQHHARIGISLDINNDTHTATVRLVVYIGNTFDTFFIYQISDIFDQFRLINKVGNLGDNDLLVIAFHFDFGFTAQDDTSPACLESVFYTGISIDSRASREIRSFDILHQICHFHFSAGIDEGHTAIQHLAKVMCRHVCRHTDGNTGTAIYQQVRNTSRQYSRFFQRIVKVQLEINRIFVNIAKHFFGKLASV